MAVGLLLPDLNAAAVAVTGVMTLVIGGLALWRPARWFALGAAVGFGLLLALYLYLALTTSDDWAF